MTGGAFAGTGALIRIALRRDRVVLPVWIVSLAFVPASTAASYDSLYPTAAERTAFAAGVARNPAVSVLYGRPLGLDTGGGYAAWRLSATGIVLIGVMAILTVVRHTRAEEDSGRAELVGATAIGRRAPLTAAMAVAAAAVVVVGLLTAVSLAGGGEVTGGSWALGLGLIGGGLVFTAVAGCTAQLFAYSRSANAAAVGVLAGSALVRSVGDSTHSFQWLSWLSPVGWSQRVQPFAGERWWVLVLPAAAVVALLVVGFRLTAVRDLGAGLLPVRPGPARAPDGFAGPLALAWRLHRGALAGWAAGLVAFSAVFGSVAQGVGDLIGDSEGSRDVLERLGGSSGLVDSFLATLIGVLGMTAALAGVQAVMRLRTEETGLRLEPLLATGTTRLRVVLAHLAMAFGGTGVLLLAAGAAMGVTHGLRSGDLGVVWTLVGAAAGQLPAVWLLVAAGVALFGLLPRATSAAWFVATGAVLVGLFGPLLDLPQALNDLSPFVHAPKLPGGDVDAVPLVALSALAVALLSAGLAGARRRDIG